MRRASSKPIQLGAKQRRSSTSAVIQRLCQLWPIIAFAGQDFDVFGQRLDIVSQVPAHALLLS